MKLYDLRQTFILILLLIVFIIITTTLYKFQLVEGNLNLAKAIKNNSSRKIIVSRRGIIFDSNGKRLVENNKRYDIYLDLGIFLKKDLDDFFSSVNDDEYYSDLLIVKSEDIDYSIREMKIFENLTETDFNNLIEKYGSYAGIVGLEDSVRTYQEPIIYSHILGYTGIPTKYDIEESDGKLSPFGQVGKNAIELYYDKFLAGVNGERYYFKNVDGAISENEVVERTDGMNLRLTIDSQWQKNLHDVVERQTSLTNAFGAAAIIMESGTGKVKALVSNPSYDSNLFSNGISSFDYNVLVSNPKRPLVNKAISSRISPGSIFKPVVLMAAINDDLIDINEYYISRGCEDISEDQRFCEADGVYLGRVNYESAIYKSSNLYFCNIGKKYGNKFSGSGVQNFLGSLDMFDIDQITGIDLIGEISSNLPNPEDLSKVQGRAWAIGDMCNMMIGQGDVLLSPIRAVLLASLFPNGGSYYKPYIVEDVLDLDGKKVLQNLPEEVKIEGISGEYFDLVHKAMSKTISEPGGTAILLKDIGFDLHIKTGSADASEVVEGYGRVEGAHSWVFGSFKHVGKYYSFAIVQLYAGRGKESVPIIGNFLNCLDIEAGSINEGDDVNSCYIY